MCPENIKNIERRIFIRHPSDVPLEVQPEGDVTLKEDSLNNVSVGGLTFFSAAPYESGAVVKIRIQLVHPPFEARGRVVWCRGSSGRFEIGVEFIETKDAFKARMVEQICQIEHYKHEIRSKEGRALSGREAAFEWINKFAGSFEHDTFEKVEK